MISKRVDVLVHIDETLDQEEQADIDGSVRSLNGVFSVHIPTQKPHLMLVEYNPDWTNAKDILAFVTHNGLHAELVGL